MERRSHKTFNDRPRPTLYRKLPPKSIEEIKAWLRLIAQMQAAVDRG